EVYLNTSNQVAKFTMPLQSKISRKRAAVNKVAQRLITALITKFVPTEQTFYCSRKKTAQFWLDG
ncbi:hypothetical protein, partial [Vibrio fluvialis]|uniref:hypothetical protein n=1 Tax=Vibrio fluvialis TaxID=676 RepID=UPI001EEB2AFD